MLEERFTSIQVGPTGRSYAASVTEPGTYMTTIDNQYSQRI